jgi:hypothetical protein
VSGFDDLRRLSVDLTEAGEGVGPFARSAVEFSANLGAKAWRRAAAGRNLGAYPASIDYEIRTPSAFGVTEIQAEIGPNLSRGVGTPGLGITEDSPGGVRGAPRRAYVAAETVIEADLPKGIEKAVDDALRRSGL